jgi:preprotein translocase subunit SecA
MKYIMRSLGMKKGENLSAPMLNRSIENAQHNIEAYYYEQRKNVLQLDNVANDQRSIVYQQRNELIELDDIADVINDIAPKVSKQIVSSIQSRTQEIDKNSIPHIQRSLQQQLHLDAQITPDINMEQLEEQISQLIVTKLLKQRELFGDGFPLIEKRCLLSTLDQCWKDHLSAMDHLRMGIGLRRYAQKNPIHEFKSEALTLFNSMLDKVRYATIQMLCTAQPKAPEPRVQSGSYSVKVSTPLMKQKNNAQETI